MGDELMLIGAAFPRTGTMSVKKALEHLGIGQCYHMQEVFLNTHHIPVWEATVSGTLPSWRNLFEGYVATLDSPACHFWKELSVAFPEAKVLLHKRDPESWYESMYATVYQVIMQAGEQADPALQMVRKFFFEKVMSGRFEDRAFAIGVYKQYCEDVIAGINEERLLVYEASQGWEPLCSFLGQDVPSIPFPKINSKNEFRNRVNLNKNG